MAVFKGSATRKASEKEFEARAQALLPENCELFRQRVVKRHERTGRFIRAAGFGHYDVEENASDEMISSYFTR